MGSRKVCRDRQVGGGRGGRMGLKMEKKGGRRFVSFIYSFSSI